MPAMSRRADFLDELIGERSASNPAFSRLVDAALERRRLLRALSEERERLGITQTQVAARVGTSQSAIARLERGEIDAKLSTVGRYAAAVGQKVAWTLEPLSSTGARPQRAAGIAASKTGSMSPRHRARTVKPRTVAAAAKRKSVS